MTKTRDLANLIADSKVGPSEIDTTGTYNMNALQVGGATVINSSRAITATGLTVDGDVTFGTGSEELFKFQGGSTNSIIEVRDNNRFRIKTGTEDSELNRLDIENNGDITFYDTDGTTASFVYDASAGTTFNEAGADRDFRVESDSNTHALFVDAGSSEVGINNDTPDAALHVKTTANNVALFDSSHVTSTQAFIRNSNAVTGTYAVLGWAPANDVSGAYIQVNAQEDFSTAANRTADMEFYTRKDGNWYQRLYMDHSATIFNENSTNTDFRVESDTNAHALFVDAGNNRIGLFNSSPSAPLHLLAGSSGGSLSDAVQIGDGTYTNIAMYSGGADGEIRIGAAGVLRGAYKAQYAGTRSANDFHVGVQDTTGMFSIDGAGAALIINERGADTDFRVESDNYANALIVDAGDDCVIAENQMRIGGVTGNSFARLQVNTAHTPSVPNTTSGLWDSTDSDGLAVYYTGLNDDAWGGKAIGGVYSKWKTPATENWVGFDFIDDRTAYNSSHKGSIIVRTRNSGSGDRAVWKFSHSGSFFPLTDDLHNIGASSFRVNDIYATNSTIQTSDQNQKQQIAALTDAEMTAAKAISKLFKTFKWNSAVEAKGDAARTHSGVIAQQVEQAMTDVGLDADDYAFFVRAVHYTDTVEGRELLFEYDDDERTATATKHEKLAIRYPELLSFIGAATEQRLTSIESRLDALEST